MWNHSFNERSAIYHIAVNFGGRKLSRFSLFPRKFSQRDPQCVRCVYADAMRMRTCARAAPIRTGAIQESFLRDILILFQNAEVFSLALKFSAIIMIPIASALYKSLLMLSNCAIYQNCGAATPYL